MTKKPNAKQMLDLPPQEFWMEVSRAITPQPWRHETGQIISSTKCYPAQRCRKCGEAFPREGYRWSRYMVYEAPGCTVPPPLTDPPEVIVRKWRDKCKKECVTGLFDAACEVLPRGASAWGDLFFATPEQQMAAILVAMNLWEVE